jgi:hypothetical protein
MKLIRKENTGKFGGGFSKVVASTQIRTRNNVARQRSALSVGSIHTQPFLHSFLASPSPSSYIFIACNKLAR